MVYKGGSVGAHLCGGSAAFISLMQITHTSCTNCIAHTVHAQRIAEKVILQHSHSNRLINFRDYGGLPQTRSPLGNPVAKITLPCL